MVSLTYGIKVLYQCVLENSGRTFMKVVLLYDVMLTTTRPGYKPAQRQHSSLYDDITNIEIFIL